MRLVWYRGKWCAYREGGKRISLRTTDRGEADRRLADLKTGINRRAMTVGQIVTAYLEDKKLKPSIASYKYAWKRAQGHFQNLLPEHVTRDVCRTYVKTRKDAAAETVRKELGVVRAALQWKDRNTPARFELPPASAPREAYLSKDQYRKLLAACNNHHLKLFTMLALATAGRKTAVLELTWDRVDFERGQIALGKGEKRVKGRATVPMTDSLRAALEDARKIALTEYVVEYAGEKVGKVDKGFRAAAVRAGLKGITPHDLRRSAAIWMAEAGTPMSEIAAYLGHRDSRITERVYARYSPTYLKTAAKALEV